MMYPLVREFAAEGFPVTVTGGVLGFSTQAFYKWAADPICDRDFHDAHLTNAIIDVHADDPEFGYRFIADELEQGGHEVSEGRVHRLCREHRIWSTTTKKGRRTTKTPGSAVHDDLVKRDFSAPAPDLVWLTDITEHPTTVGIQGERRKALRLRHQGRLLEPDRRLRPLGSHDGRSGRCLFALSGGTTPTSRNCCGPLRPGRPISFSTIPSRAQGKPPHRLDGTSLLGR
jgi:HTH-like domain